MCLRLRVCRGVCAWGVCVCVWIPFSEKNLKQLLFTWHRSYDGGRIIIFVLCLLSCTNSNCDSYANSFIKKCNFFIIIVLIWLHWAHRSSACSLCCNIFYTTGGSSSFSIKTMPSFSALSLWMGLPALWLKQQMDQQWNNKRMDMIPRYPLFLWL